MPDANVPTRRGRPAGRPLFFFCALFAAAAVLATCRRGPEFRPLIADDHDRLIALMGGIDSHLLEIQRGAGDPIEPAYLKVHLAGFRTNLEKVCALRDPKFKEFRGRARRAIEQVRALEQAEWTPENRRAYYKSLKALCTGCHEDVETPVYTGPPQPNSWQRCGRCHEKEYKEWKETLHQEAWTDKVYLMSAGKPPKLECRGCHSMEPILAREISADVTYRPVYRPYNQEEGVNCVACHGLADGSVAARRDIPDAPCRPRRDDRLLSPVFCGACHNPSHLAYDEWKLSKSGKTCRECHALKDGKFTHRMLGVFDHDFVKKAIPWSCDVKDGRLTVTITNRSGHKMPAEVPSRILRLRITIDGEQEELFFRRPNKAIVGEKDNRFLPDETRHFRRDVAGAKQVKVEILYQQSPFVQPLGWVVVGRWEKSF